VRRLEHLGMFSETEVIIGAHVEHRGAPRRLQRRLA
jgi:hypothetical protein